jgi:exopolysaccharide biosynthesis polyprenyl glycosylphosphotransferase
MSTYKSVAMALDAGAVALALLIAHLLKEIVVDGDPVSFLRYQTFGLATALAFVPIAARLRLYQERFLSRRIEELRRVVRAAVVTMTLMVVAGFATKTYFARSYLVFGLLLSVVLLTTEREAVRRAFAIARRRGRLQRPAVIVGTNAEAAAVEDAVDADPSNGYRVVGRIDPSGDDLVDRVITEVDAAGATTVLIVASAVSLADSGELIRRLTEAGVHVEMTTALSGIASERLTMRVLGRHPVLYIEPVRRAGWRSLAKRGFDITVASATLLITLPVLAAAAVAIKLDSPGPVFFRQQRVGRNGELFEVWKLRTMRADAEQLRHELEAQNEADGPLFKMVDDPRVTRVGRFLRASSIDEIPQLWNVLRNEMSLVGPRPALPSELGGWTPQLFNRLRVKPGMTGMWQVSGRSSTTFAEYTALDLYYVDNWSLLIDVSILAKTIPAVLAKRGSA